MVPRIAKPGHSFKGAALYYLHDKGAQTAERVAWTETVNLPTDDPQRATAHMIDTAAHAEELKLAAGSTRGRKLEKPVYCYSLAWHPDEAPAREEQLQAARETLHALELQDHQALIVAHSDQKHPHVHVIVNRVHPETGKAASRSQDRRILSAWAQGYEEHQGKILCPAREQNNRRRAQGQFVKDRSPTRQEWQAAQKAETKQLWESHRADKAEAIRERKASYEALWTQRQGQVSAVRQEVKEAYRPIWRDVFKRQRAELARFDTSLSARIGFALRHYDRGKGLAVLRAFTTDQGQRREFVKAQGEERRQITQEQRARVAQRTETITEAWQASRDALKAQHRAEDAARLKATREEVDRVWKAEPMPQPKQDLDRARAPDPPEKTPDKAPKKESAVKRRLREQRERAKGRTRNRGPRRS